MLVAFMSVDLWKNLRSLFATDPRNAERSDNLWLLSIDALDTMKTGERYFDVQPWANHSDTTLIQTYNILTNMFASKPGSRHLPLIEEMALENRTPERTLIINEEVLKLHARLSKAMAWEQAAKYVGTKFGSGPQRWIPSLLPTALFWVLKSAWAALPSFIRAHIYDGLVWIGSRLYGPSLSMVVHKLPFGLYLRRGSPRLATKHEVEAHTLGMIEQFTSIPAPRAIDVIHTPRFSYLLMTCVPGRPIGQMLDEMTDEQLDQAVTDLKRYVNQLRQISNKTPEFKICNSVGGGFLEWRIPDSQREELRFKTEADFNRYLSSPLRAVIREKAAVSHDIPHDIVFTHGDLNPRNILAENGKITGIVDWENAGWFPEYWEFAKSHYTVRSVIRWLADVVDRVFEGYRDELIVENMLSDALGPM